MPILYWPVQFIHAPLVGLGSCCSRRNLSTPAILILTDNLLWFYSVIRAVKAAFCIMEFSVAVNKLKVWVIFVKKFLHCWIKKKQILCFLGCFFSFSFYTMLSMTEQQLNTWMWGQNIFLTEGGEKNNTQQDTCQKFNPPLSKPLRFCPNFPRTYTREDNTARSFGLEGKKNKTLHCAIECVVECWLKSHLDASSIFQKPNFVCLGQKRLVAAAKDAPATQPTCVTHVAAERLSLEQQTVTR